VVCEATGSHEAALLSALLQAGRAAHRADARKVKAFIRSFGTLGKADAIAPAMDGYDPSSATPPRAAARGGALLAKWPDHSGIG